jgi:hypothetical protein
VDEPALKMQNRLSALGVNAGLGRDDSRQSRRRMTPMSFPWIRTSS